MLTYTNQVNDLDLPLLGKQLAIQELDTAPWHTSTDQSIVDWGSHCSLHKRLQVYLVLAIWLPGQWNVQYRIRVVLHNISLLNY